MRTGTIAARDERRSLVFDRLQAGDNVLALGAGGIAFRAD
jgi:hypothetical protein